MSEMLTIQLNGHARAIENIDDPATLAVVIAALGLAADRVAVELNGEIVRRAAWASTTVQVGDRLEVVHFVGGGSGQQISVFRSFEASKRRAFDYTEYVLSDIESR